MGKYTPLENYLRRQPLSTTQIVLTFAKIEEIIGDVLPPSARIYFKWWDSKPRDGGNKYWLDIGWKTTMIDIENQKVKFQRI
ncbi:hypothetical protein ACFLTR_02115 [Chloroflexota bacterium]